MGRAEKLRLNIEKNLAILKRLQNRPSPIRPELRIRLELEQPANVKAVSVEYS